MTHSPSWGRELAEVGGLIGAVTVAGWFSPFDFHALGHVYLLAVILLSLRVSRGPALVAAVGSALVWDYVFIPPRLSLSLLDLDECLLLGTYFVVAMTAGQLTSLIRAQQRSEQRRERRATALFHLTRALAGARTLDDGVAAALAQVDGLFEGQSALLLPDEHGHLVPHRASTLAPDAAALAMAEWCWRCRREAGRFTATSPDADCLYLPLRGDGPALGVLMIRPPAHAVRSSPRQHDLFEAFAAQIALLVQREQLRSAGERAQILAESDRLHRTLLDSVSHELRTPLAVLQAAAENLARDGAARHPALPAEILTATRRLNRMVGNLLSQSRLEAGGIRPLLDWCDVRDLVASARRELGDALAGRPLRLDLADDMPLLLADAALLEHVFTNLLLNAALYCPAGSPLTIIAGLDEARGRVYVTFADEGPGIPAGLRAQLFQKFRRGESRGGNGLGLGLSIVRGLMQAQGGDVLAEDHAGRGARLTIHLPHRPHTSVPQE
ncbi:MAG TPA: ATP-binding protein [Lacunisphaera sp.]|nr:ATP-binding protein [Lacunisphaera sp.]